MNDQTKEYSLNDVDDWKIIESIRAEVAKASPSDRQRIIEKFILAALGSIPWVGAFIGAAASYKTEEGSVKTSRLQTQWLEEHANKIERLMNVFSEILQRFESLGSQIDERIRSEEYLSVVRQAFQAWDRANTDEKRKYIRNLVSNSAGTKLCSDDIIRLFIDWLELFHEMHFAVIREIYKNPGITRYDIWAELYGELPREDSAEADLFRLLIRDLSTGGVVRQERDTDLHGRFLRKKNPRRRGTLPDTVETAFEDKKPYVLTELGKQFVHYTIEDIVRKIDNK